jgi:hypothetical protein
MSSSSSDNPSASGSKNPVVRVKGFQKTSTAPPVTASAISPVQQVSEPAPNQTAAPAEPESVPEAPPPDTSAIRQRFPAETPPATEPPAAANATKPDQKYVPDNDPERINRRQWWKHNLYVKSGRQKDEAPQ